MRINYNEIIFTEHYPTVIATSDINNTGRVMGGLNLK